MSGIVAPLWRCNVTYFTKIAVFCLIASAGAVLAQTQPVYKWTDENGVVHFSEAPPARNDAVERMEMTRTPDPVNEAQAVDEVDPNSRDQAIAVNIAEECTKARRNLQVLTTYTNINDYDDQGNATQLTPEQKQARLESTQTYITQYCEES